MSAVTDSGNEVKLDWKNKPGISNLLEIYSQISGRQYSGGNNYGEFKWAVADVVEKFLINFQQKYKEISEVGKAGKCFGNWAKRSYEISRGNYWRYTIGGICEAVSYLGAEIDCPFCAAPRNASCSPVAKRCIGYRTSWRIVAPLEISVPEYGHT